MKKTRTVDDYIAAESRWQKEVRALRAILLPLGLAEEVKWGAPCYTLDGQHIVGIGAFKSYFGLWFFQGALLDDKNGVLVNAQEGKTKAMRQWRMQSADDIKPVVIRRYVKEAVKNAKAGKRIKPAPKTSIALPAELKEAFDRREATHAAFSKLHPGQQRAYCEYVGAAKREDTRQRRVDKILPMIEKGIGLNDKYR